MPTESAQQALSILRQGAQTFQWYVIPLLAVVIYIYANEIQNNQGSLIWQGTVDVANVKNDTVVYAAEGDNVKITVDGTDADGKPAHNEWTGKFDGLDYPVQGIEDVVTNAYRRVDDRSYDVIQKVDGVISLTARMSVSPDGKRLTTVKVWEVSAAIARDE